MEPSFDKKINILLVEDSPVQAELMRRQLSKQFETECIDSLSKLRPFLVEKKADIILLDLNLVDTQGLQTYLECRAQAPATPIIVLTITDDDKVALEAIRKGAQDFLVKDKVDEKVILRAIRYSMERHESQKETLDLLFSDELTKLNNRRAFQILAEGQIRLAMRNSKNCILVYLDVDNFKQVNDQNGHLVGDETLRAVSYVLKNSFRESDVLARVGGDEFAVLAIDANEEDKSIIANRIEKNIKEYNSQKDFPKISVSYGMAMFHYESPQSIKVLLKEADEKMYQHKKSKKP